MNGGGPYAHITEMDLNKCHVKSEGTELIIISELFMSLLLTMTFMFYTKIQ